MLSLTRDACFHLSEEYVTAPVAAAKCAQMGSRLASVATLDELNDMINTFPLMDHWMGKST